MSFSFLKRLFGSEVKDGGALPPMVDATAPEESVSNTADSVPANAPEVLNNLKEFVKYVVTSLVDKPEQVSLEVAEKRDLTVIQVHCFKKDIGKVIGKSGKTITALRTLVSSAASRNRLHITVDVMDD
ncbi:MAG: KH domain-containing protein [Lentisphaeria bacterium]|nr:KH domain-containing protein [Lentisphaeria bacterium]